MSSEKWIKCPVCGNKTRSKMRDDTEAKSLPVYCSKCKRESLVNIMSMKVTVIKVLDARRRANVDE